VKFRSSLLATCLLIACSGGSETGINETENLESQNTSEPALAAEPEALHMYVLDCGTIQISNLDGFSSAGDYAGQTAVFADTCWLIRHPDGDLLWDLGLTTELVGGGEQEIDVLTLSMDRSLTEQMRDFGYAPWDLDYVAISHSHFDHTGQADQFQEAKWLVHQAEYDSMFPETPEALENDPDVDGEVTNPYSNFASLSHETFTGEYDVFGDGSVVIFPTPGHTPGHTTLQVMLPETGPVLLTGDLYHRRESRELRRVPRFNSDETQTLASMDAFEARAAALGAKVIIQHSQADIAELPHPPEALR
jgi:glyoxylase-like metal-dependent hydrolase (beta-lactamase superfamily II)